MFKRFMVSILVISGTMLFAGNGIYKVSAKKDFSSALKSLTHTLDKQNLYIISKANISSTLKRMKNKLGADYNKQHFDSVTSIIFCNPFYANEVMNLDPDMMALCPLKIMLMEKNGKTTALFVLPTTHASKSSAKKVLKEIENKVKKALKSAGFK